MSKFDFEKKGKLLLCALIPLIAAIGIFVIANGGTSLEYTNDIHTIGDVSVEMAAKEDNSSLDKLSASANVPYAIGVKNTGANEAYVFMTITVPYVSDAQTVAYFSNTAGITSEWKIVSVGTNITDVSSVKNNAENYGIISGDTITYVYGYIGNNADGTLKALATGDKTSYVFDYLKLENGSTMATMNSECFIKTNVYAVQTTEFEGAVSINDAWAIVNK
jgi:hypothetical protein